MGLLDIFPAYRVANLKAERDQLELDNEKEKQVELLSARRAAGLLATDATQPSASSPIPKGFPTLLAAGYTEPTTPANFFARHNDTPDQYGTQATPSNLGAPAMNASNQRSLGVTASGGPLAVFQAAQAARAALAAPQKLGPGDVFGVPGQPSLMSAPFKPEEPTDFEKGLLAAGLKPGSAEYMKAASARLAHDSYIPDNSPLNIDLKKSEIGKNNAEAGRIGLPPGYMLGAPTASPGAAPATPAAPGVVPGRPAMVPMPGSPQETELNQKKAGDQAAYDSAHGSFQQLIDKANEISADKNLDNVTGMMTGQPYVPTTHQASVDTLNNIDTLKSRLVIGAMQAARQGSQSGATGFGALSEKELGVLENMVAKLDTRLDAPTFRKRLAEISQYAAKQQSTLRSARQIATGQKPQGGATGGWSAKQVN